jgi:isoleucyl-tRNA synthetase
MLLVRLVLLHIQGVIAEHGSDAWWSMDVKDLLPDIYENEAHKWKKGTGHRWMFGSTLDLAGMASPKAVTELAYPADIYLEGSDQHRGWFQSSLLTSVAAKNQAPYKTVLTHGFVLDEKGFKMSKSLGNVVDCHFYGH